MLEQTAQVPGTFCPSEPVLGIPPTDEREVPGTCQA